MKSNFEATSYLRHKILAGLSEVIETKDGRTFIAGTLRLNPEKGAIEILDASGDPILECRDNAVKGLPEILIQGIYVAMEVTIRAM